MKFLLLIFFCTGISNWVTSLVNTGMILEEFILKAVIVTIIYWVIMFLTYCKSPEYKYYYGLIKTKIIEVRR